MSVFVKLKEDTYIEWSKSSDSPASFVLNKQRVIEEITQKLKIHYLLQNIAYTPEFLNKSVDDLFCHLENHGTTDSLKIVNLSFILDYNRSGDNESILSLEEILAKYSQPN